MVSVAILGKCNDLVQVPRTEEPLIAYHSLSKTLAPLIVTI